MTWKSNFGKDEMTDDILPDGDQTAATATDSWTDFGMRRSKTVLRRVVVCALLTGGWITLGRFGIVSPQAFDAGTLVVATVLFFVGIPLSFYLRVDEAGVLYGFVETEHKLAFALGIAALNIALFTYAFGAVKKLLGREGASATKKTRSGKPDAGDARSTAERKKSANARSNGRPRQ